MQDAKNVMLEKMRSWTFLNRMGDKPGQKESPQSNSFAYEIAEILLSPFFAVICIISQFITVANGWRNFGFDFSESLAIHLSNLFCVRAGAFFQAILHKHARCKDI